MLKMEFVNLGKSVDVYIQQQSVIDYRSTPIYKG